MLIEDAKLRKELDGNYANINSETFMEEWKVVSSNEQGPTCNSSTNGNTHVSKRNIGNIDLSKSYSVSEKKFGREGNDDHASGHKMEIVKKSPNKKRRGEDEEVAASDAFPNIDHAVKRKKKEHTNHGYDNDKDTFDDNGKGEISGKYTSHGNVAPGDANKLFIDKDNLFHEINLLIRKKLKISDVVKIDLFCKDNCTQIKPYVLFDEYKHVNIESKIHSEIETFLKNCLKNGRRYINIHNSVVELRGSFNGELINLPIINHIILQKISNNNYKYKFNIDADVLNYIYVDLFKIHKSKYKFKILEKKYEIEEWYYYSTGKNKRKGISNGEGVVEASVKGKDQFDAFPDNVCRGNENGKGEKKKEDEDQNSSSSECYESDALISLYNEEKRKEEKKLRNSENEHERKKKRKKKIIDKDKLYIEKLKKLVEENSEQESNASSNEKSSGDSDDSSNDNKNYILYRRKIIYAQRDKRTVRSVFKEVENDNLCVYYPNSCYNQCLMLSVFEAVSGADGDGISPVGSGNYDMYEHRIGKNCRQGSGQGLGQGENQPIEEGPSDLNFLNEENIRVKKRYVRDISIYSFCCDDKYKGCSLYLHIARNKKVRNVRIDYNIDYEHFADNCDVIKLHEWRDETSMNNPNTENKKKNVGKMFELEKDFKINVDMYIDIEKVVKEFKKKYYPSENADVEKSTTTHNGSGGVRTNKLDYVIYNFNKNFECMINFINKLKNSTTKFDYFYPKMLGDVNDEIRKHYDKKKVILLKKSNIKYIRIFNNEVKRLMILFFVSYNSKILDLACGHGQDMLKYNTVRNKIYVGIDISKKEIELAKERLNQNDVKGLCNNDNFIFLQGDILNNKFYKKWKKKNIMFDIISINLALHYVMYNEKSSKRFFKIIENFLEDEGLLLVTTISTITLTEFFMNRAIIDVVSG